MKDEKEGMMNQDTIDYLKNFKTLLDEGIITQEEFEAKKQTLLLGEYPQDPAPKETELQEPAGQPVKTANRSKQATKSSARPIDIIWIVVGAVFVVIGLFGFLVNGPKGTFGADYMTYQYSTSAYMVQAIYIVVAAIGGFEICMGLKGMLAKDSDDERASSTKQ